MISSGRWDAFSSPPEKTHGSRFPSIPWPWPCALVAETGSQPLRSTMQGRPPDGRKTPPERSLEARATGGIGAHFFHVSRPAKRQRVDSTAATDMMVRPAPSVLIARDALACPRTRADGIMVVKEICRKANRWPSFSVEVRVKRRFASPSVVDRLRMPSLRLRFRATSPTPCDPPESPGFTRRSAFPLGRLRESRASAGTTSCGRITYQVIRVGPIAWPQCQG